MLVVGTDKEAFCRASQRCRSWSLSRVTSTSRSTSREQLARSCALSMVHAIIVRCIASLSSCDLSSSACNCLLSESDSSSILFRSLLPAANSDSKLSIAATRSDSDNNKRVCSSSSNTPLAVKIIRDGTQCTESAGI